MIQIEPILYIGAAQSFFAGLLISTKQPFTTANRMMAAWLFLIFIELVFAIINRTLLQFYSFPFIAFTYGPLLYLYACHATKRKNEFNWFNLFHFIPFVTFFAVSVWLRDYQLFMNPTGFFRPDSMISLRIVYGTSFFLSVSVYSIMTFLVIRRHQHDMVNSLSFKSAAATLNWLKVISISFYSVYLVLFILGGIDIIGNYIPFDPYYIVFMFVALFSFALSFYGVKQPELFTYNTSTITAVENNIEPAGNVKYMRSGLRSEEAEEILSALIEVMIQKKPYLERELTIYDLAAMTGISRHHITQTLNEHHGRNFYTFINEFRVNEAAIRLSDPRFRNYTILAIAYDSGFNSKSAFNRIFREMKGMTPREYRQMQLQEDTLHPGP